MRRIWDKFLHEEGRGVLIKEVSVVTVEESLKMVLEC